MQKCEMWSVAWPKMSQIRVSLGSGRICKRQGTKLPQNFGENTSKMGKIWENCIEICWNIFKYVPISPDKLTSFIRHTAPLWSCFASEQNQHVSSSNIFEKTCNRRNARNGYAASGPSFTCQKLVPDRKGNCSLWPMFCCKTQVNTTDNEKYNF